VADHPGDRLGSKKVAVVQEPPGQPVRPLVELQAQVELRRPGVDIALRDLPPVRGRRRVRLERQQYLHERLVAQAPVGLHFLHDGVEGHALVVADRLARRLRPRQHLADGRLARQVGAQHHGVEEAPHHGLQLRPGPPRDRQPEQQVFLAGVAGQQRLESRRQDHRQGDVLAPAQLPQRRAQLAAERERLHPAPVARLPRPLVVSRQLQHRRRARQVLLPEVQVPAQLRLLLRVPLPGRVVGVLRGRLAEPRGPAVHPCLVQLPQLRQEDAGQRHVVGDDVVQGQVQPVLPVAEADQQRPHQRALRQVERLPGLLLGPVQRLLRGISRRQLPQVGRRPAELRLRLHYLGRLPVRAGEAGAPDLVSADERRQAVPQRRRVQVAAQGQRPALVVERDLRHQLVQEPQLFLLVGQWQGLHGRELSRLIHAFFLSLLGAAAAGRR
jgi:hypothetical protein